MIHNIQNVDTMKGRLKDIDHDRNNDNKISNKNTSRAH
jgi:hypothetical protein